MLFVSDALHFKLPLFHANVLTCFRSGTAPPYIPPAGPYPFPTTGKGPVVLGPNGTPVGYPPSYAAAPLAPPQGVPQQQGATVGPYSAASTGPATGFDENSGTPFDGH